MAAGAVHSRLRLSQPFGKCSHKNQFDQSTWVTCLASKFAPCLIFSCLIFRPAIAQTPVDNRGKLVPESIVATVSAAQLGVPGKAWAHLQSAHKEFSKSNLAGAAREIDRALHVDPVCAPAFSMRAFLKLAAKDPQGAIADAEHAAALDPHDAESFVALAMAHNSLQEFQPAAEAARRALALRADSWQGKLELAKSSYGQGQLIPALRELDEVGKDFPDVHLVRGQVLMSLGRRQDAVQEFGLFLKQEPSDPRRQQIERILERGPARSVGVTSPANEGRSRLPGDPPVPR